MHGFVRFTAFLLCLLVAAPPVFAVRIDPNDNNSEIQRIIDNAAADDEIVFPAGTYHLNLVLKSDLKLRGEETARTILQSDNSQLPVISINGATDITIKRLTFLSAGTGIEVTGGSSVIEISNSVFQIESAGTGVRIASDAVAEVRNNTFHGAGTGISRNSDAGKIEYNIFSGNNLAIDAIGSTGIAFNCFANYSSIGEKGEGAETSGTLTFANSTAAKLEKRDFHLAMDSLCIGIADGPDAADTDNRRDAGAYGGPEADTRPYPVQNLTANAVADNGTYNIQLKWSPNNSYRITRKTDPGVYLVYYDSDESGKPYEGTDATDVNSEPVSSGKIAVAASTDSSAASYTLYHLTDAAVQPAAPLNVTAAPASGRLDLIWEPVAGANGYRIYYSADGIAGEPVSLGKESSHSLTGLQNGVAYTVAVSALTQKQYFLSVVAVNSLAMTGAATLDAAIKSEYAAEQTVALGEVLESAKSDEVIATPEALQAYPQLANEGCFIATAAFGYYDAGAVLPLRQFRDQYLLVNTAGRSFVRWYYREGPAAARWLRNHPGFKPLVRAALVPLIVVAWLSVNLPTLSLLLLVGLPLIIMVRRRRRGRVLI